MAGVEPGRTVYIIQGKKVFSHTSLIADFKNKCWHAQAEVRPLQLSSRCSQTGASRLAMRIISRGGTPAQATMNFQKRSEPSTRSACCRAEPVIC